MSDNRSIDIGSKVTLSSAQISSELGGEIVIMNLQSGVYHGVEGVAAFIWKILAQPVAVQEICDRVSREYEVESGQCRTDVLNLLNQFLKEGLIVLVDSSEKVPVS